MVGYNFEYCGKSLRDFGYIMAKPDTEDNFGLSRDIIKGNATPFKNSVAHFGTKYDGSLILNIFIVKDVIENNKDTVMSGYELRDLLAWLTSVKTPKNLIVENYDGEIIEYCGLFTNVEPFSTNKLNGIRLTFECDSQYAYKRQILRVNNTTNLTVTKNFYCDTDELNEFVYPKITIKTSQGGANIEIKNVDENRKIALSIPQGIKEIMIDCNLRRIVANGKLSSFSDVGWQINPIVDANGVSSEMYNIYWLNLLPGRNKISFSGKANFTIECKLPLKIGGYIDDV